MSIIESIPRIKHFESDNFFLIAGPCIIESEEIAFKTAQRVKTITDKYGIPFIFKSSYKKANRSKLNSFSGIGNSDALRILKDVSDDLHIPVITDVHSKEEAGMAAKYVDIIQIPAFLCRQTDMLVAAGETGKFVNIKKGQFLSPEGMAFAAEKVASTGNNKILLTERGTTFGYHDLVVDYRGIVEMQRTKYPVVLDITHSLQQPNQLEGVSGGQPEFIETIARAGIAVGVDGLFLETHPDPKNAKSDGHNMLPLNELDGLLSKLLALRATVNNFKKK
jgi:2-dehydro-3-deoxyphosphooctonate aldolase (KDO 8-P synthase)